MILLRFLILFVFLIPLCGLGHTFHFAKDLESWGTWGEGLGEYDPKEGHQGAGSLWLSTDFGETHTSHYRWDNLTPGKYQITFYARALDVQKGREGTSFWHFYDRGMGTESAFQDLHGSFDWRKISYTISINQKDFSIWFRLKSPGQIWVDDFSFVKVDENEKELSIAPEVPFKKKIQQKSIGQSKKFKKVINAFNGQKKGRVTSGSYHNFSVKSILGGNWTGVDRIEMDVYNPSNEFYEFYLTLTDSQTTNYWSQLNHKTHLSPGHNRLSFSLTQFVGERGSHRFHRPVNLSKLEKFFIVIDPDSRQKKKLDFTIENLTLSSNPYPEIPTGVLAFNFTSHKAPEIGQFTKVTTQNLYNSENGYGFVSPEFWRVEDSKYTSELLRFTIGMKEGVFRVKVPNGKYQFQLLIDQLGYWDPPFWQNRLVRVNGLPVYSSHRDTDRFLKDLLRFESIYPDSTDHPYDLYLSKIFNPIVRTVTVTNGFLDFEFVGDASAISLNTLIIWPVEKSTQATNFFAALDSRHKEEFDWMSRKIAVKGEGTKPGPEFSIVEGDLLLHPETSRNSTGDQLSFSGGREERPYQVIQIRPKDSGHLSWKLTEVKSSDGKTIKEDNFAISEVIYQFTSPDLNHESYLLAGKYLKPVKSSATKVTKDKSHYLWIELPITKNHQPGDYEGTIEFTLNKTTHQLPVKVSVSNYELPSVDFPVGFFGLDPIQYTYFPDDKFEEIRSRYRKLALETLLSRGFTTFSGLPEAKLLGAGEIDTREIDSLFSLMKKHKKSFPVFSYSGKFPHTLLEGDKNLRKALKTTLASKDWPPIVHTFSDEPSGYSNRVQEDIEAAKKLRENFPFLNIGGFSGLGHRESIPLHKQFDYGFYSSLYKDELRMLKNQKWGSYNGSPGNLHDPRFSIGPGLFVARSNGLSQYLEWHLTGFNNYPYYELDGRESDVSMFLPSSSGELYETLRFKLAVQGLETYRKLKLLETLPEANPARKWLKNFVINEKFFSNPTYLQRRDFDFKSFNSELNTYIKQNFK